MIRDESQKKMLLQCSGTPIRVKVRERQRESERERERVRESQRDRKRERERETARGRERVLDTIVVQSENRGVFEEFL